MQWFYLKSPISLHNLRYQIVMPSPSSQGCCSIIPNQNILKSIVLTIPKVCILSITIITIIANIINIIINISLNHLTIPKVCPFIDQTESPFTFVVLSTPDMVLKWLAPFIALMTAKKKIISHGWYLWNLWMLRISLLGGFGFFQNDCWDQWWWYDGHPWYSWLLSAENTTDELSVHLNW